MSELAQQSPLRTPATSPRVLFAVAAVVTAGVLPVFLAGGLGVQLQRELAFGPAVLGLATAGFFAVAALASRLMGAVAARMGAVPAMRLAAIGSSACLLGIASAENAVWLVGALWLAGLPNALGQPASNLLIAQRVAHGRRATAFGVKQAAIPAGTLLAGLAVPAVALTIGWRWAFVLAAVAGVVAALTVPVAGTENVAEGGRADQQGNPGRALLILIAIACGLGSAAANSLGAFVTSTAVHVGFGQAVAGMVLSLGSVAGLTVRLGAGVLVDRKNPDPLLMITLMLLLGSAGFGLMALPLATMFLIGAVVGFGAGWAWPGLLNFAVADLYPDRVAGATSVSQTGVYVGGSCGPLLFGVLAAHAGLSIAWLAAASVAVVGAALLWWVHRRARYGPRREAR